VYGECDVAFYDLAESMANNITKMDKAAMSSKDLSEKGYINTFNHIVAQAMISAIFSERMADFIADAHERRNMPSLITGEFTREQLTDIENGPADNYLDIINNEWGQEIGKQLKTKYNICRSTVWTQELLVECINDIQSYCSRVFGIGFEPFWHSDEVIIRFAEKLNVVLH